MLNLNNINDVLIESFDSFHYWFLPTKPKAYLVYKREEDGTFTCIEEMLTLVYSESNPMPEEYREDWIKFTNRPEYNVSNYTPNTPHVSIDVYERLILGCVAIRSFRTKQGEVNPDDTLKHAIRCIEWIRSTDFYTAPGSTRFHDAFIGGLLDHTLRVVGNIVNLSLLPNFNRVNLEDAILCALVHDWCKIGLYESYNKNVKDDSSGKWRQETAFRWRDSHLTTFGHGVSSLFLAQKFFHLTLEQCLAIRWHMGAWNVCDSEVNDLQESNESYPLVHMLQFADQLSIVKY